MADPARRFRAVKGSQELAPRFFSHDGYRTMLAPRKGGLALLGFLNVLLGFSVEGVVEGRTVLVVDLPRPQLSELAGVSLSSVRRLEAELAKAGAVRVVATGRASRVLEVLPPAAVPLRRSGSQVVTRDHLKSGGELDHAEGQVVTGDHLRWSGVTISGGHVRPPERDLSLLSGKERQVGKSERAGAREDQASLEETNPDPEASESARRVGAGLSAKLADQRAAGREGCGLGGKRKSELVELLAVRWSRYGLDREAADQALQRDAERVLGFALGRDVRRPVGYLLAAIRRGDWRADPAPGSQAAEVATAGPSAERPLQNLDARTPGGMDSGDLEDAQERFRRAKTALLTSGKLNRQQESQLRPMSAPRTAVGAMGQAIEFEKAMLRLGVST